MASPLHICIVVPGHCNEKFCFENILYFRYKWTSKSSTAGGVREQTNRLTHWHTGAFMEWYEIYYTNLSLNNYSFEILSWNGADVYEQFYKNWLDGAQLLILKNIPIKFKLIPFSSLGVMEQTYLSSVKLPKVNHCLHICDAKYNYLHKREVMQY